MGPRNLLGLPAELRSKIYTFVFAESAVYINSSVYTSPPGSQAREQQQAVSILQSCAQLRHEAIPVYFSQVKVYFDVCESMAPLGLINWLDDIGEENSKLIRHFRMKWNNYVDISLDLGRQAAESAQHASHRAYNRPSQRLMSASTAPTYDFDNDFLHQTLTLENPTRSLRTGEKHCIAVEGTPIYGPEYWNQMGTLDFSSALAWILSQRLKEVLKGRRGVSLTRQDLIDFVIDADQHGSGLRWLWYW